MHKHLLLRLAVLLVLAACAGTAAARGGPGHGGGHYRGSVGFYFNDPYYWGPDPFFYPYRPYVYSPPPVIIEQRDPPVYIQRQPTAPPAPPSPSAWYYCQNPAGYYPYVQSCSQPWVSVDPRSVSPPPAR